MNLGTALGLTTYTFEVYSYVFTIAAINATEAKKLALAKMLDEHLIDDKDHAFEWGTTGSPTRFYMFEENRGD